LPNRTASIETGDYNADKDGRLDGFSKSKNNATKFAHEFAGNYTNSPWSSSDRLYLGICNPTPDFEGLSAYF